MSSPSMEAARATAPASPSAEPAAPAGSSASPPVGPGDDLAQRYDQLELVYRLADAVARAASLDDVFVETLNGLQRALRVERASILLFDPEGVMRFTAWRGISERYRRAVEGHSPWTPETVDPEPLIVTDIEKDASLVAYREIFAAERIRALAFLPLVAEGRLLGKFMLYYDAPHRLAPDDLRLARTLASHIALAIARHRGELALRESEERYRRLVDVSPVGVLVHAEGRIVFANPAAARLLGAATSRELLGRAMLEFVHPDFHARLLERVTQVEEGATQMPAAERRFLRVDGEPIEVEATKIGFTWQGRPAVQIVIRDITERRRADEARRLLIEAGTTLASSLDHETTLQRVAGLAVPAFADWCLVDLLEESGGFHRLAVAHADPAQAELARALRRHYDPLPDAALGVSAVVRHGRSEFVPEVRDDILVALARDEGHLAALRGMRMVSFISVPLTAHGRILGALTFATAGSGRRYGAHDLTLAEELARRAAIAVDNARLYREAREANRAKSQFLATMSHELRTPLNAIAGYAELMELGVHGPITDAQREALRRIAVNQRHLLGLITDVLSFARLETGRLEFAIGDVRVEETLELVRALIEPQMQARGLRYEYRAGDPTVTCRADPDKLQQILVNLLGNAVKFTAPGGCVALDWAAASDVVAIRVRDTGRGIPAGKLEQIFEPFVQLDGGFSARAEGTGLGLAISRELARAMRGEIHVESVLGEGSTFTLTVPRR